MLLDLILILLLVATNGFFVAAEFALVKVRLSEIEALAEQGSKTAAVAKNIINQLDTYLSACQLGITLASLALGWIGEQRMATMLEPVVRSAGFAGETAHLIAIPIGFAIITFLHITAGEQVPKILAIQKCQLTSLFIGFPLLAFYKIFRPFIWFLNVSSNFMLKAIGISLISDHSEGHTEMELRLTLMSAAAGGHVTHREQHIMENVLDMESKSARRYMMPRREIVYINGHDSMEEKLRIAAESGHTRFPLCDEDLDQILGVVHIKDMFKALINEGDFTSLTQVAREPLFLPETIKLDALLGEFQRRHSVFAILVDEYGVASGMITLENVIEELVGPILDEFDFEPPQIIRKGLNRYEVEASCPVDTAIRVCQLELPEELTSDTIGGIMIELLGHIPQAGENVPAGVHLLTALQVEPTRIQKLSIDLLPDRHEHVKV
ncbi:MAG: hemolysin family protein [Candidatus Latescibacteria bacterium]|nr:hemolysin family protein [Candidatus Latescibacterota bacterium]